MTKKALKTSKMRWFKQILLDLNIDIEQASMLFKKSRTNIYFYTEDYKNNNKLINPKLDDFLIFFLLAKKIKKLDKYNIEITTNDNLTAIIPIKEILKEKNADIKTVEKRIANLNKKNDRKTKI